MNVRNIQRNPHILLGRGFPNASLIQSQAAPVEHSVECQGAIRDPDSLSMAPAETVSGRCSVLVRAAGSKVPLKA